MSLILTILLVVDLFLWFLTLLPATPAGWGWATSWLAFIAVLPLTLLVVAGGSTLALR